MQTSSTESVPNGPPMMAPGIPSRAALMWGPINRLDIAVVLVLLFAALASTMPGFASNHSIQGLLLPVTLIGSISAMMMFVLAFGEVDLSVASTVAFAGVMTSVLTTATHSVVPDIGAGILVGSLVELVNGALVARYQISSLIVTLAMMEVVRDFVSTTSNGDAVVTSEERFFDLGDGPFSGISYPTWSDIVDPVLFGFLLEKTVFGKNVLAVGGNKEAALPVGLLMMHIKIVVFVLQGFMTGFTDVMLVLRMSLGDPEVSVGFELGMISACALGGVSLTGGVVTVSGMLIGVLVMGSAQNAMSPMNVSTFYRYLIRGDILLLAVWSDRIRQNKRAS